MKLLIDANVVLDLALHRSPWARDAGRLFTAIERGEAAGFVAGHTVTTIYYVVHKMINAAAAHAAVLELLRVVDVVPVEKADLQQASALGLRDFEDSVQAVCATKAGADYIVTRDEEDFRGFSVPTIAPGAILALL